MKKGFFSPVRDLKIERKNPGGAVQIWKCPVFQKTVALLSVAKGLKANPYPIFSNLSLSPIDELVRVCFVD
jgi:hypothetical protein